MLVGTRDGKTGIVLFPVRPGNKDGKEKGKNGEDIELGSIGVVAAATAANNGFC